MTVVKGVNNLVYLLIWYFRHCPVMSSVLATRFEFCVGSNGS